MYITRLLVCLPFVMLAAELSQSAYSPSVPRYKFEPGQEYTYRSSSSFKYGEKENAG